MRYVRGIALLALLAPVGCTDLFYDDADGGRSGRRSDQGDAESVVDSGTFGQDAESTDAESGPFSFNVATPPRIVQGTTATIPLSMVRNGITASDIQITVTGLPAGVVATPLTIPASASSGDLQITVAADVPQGPLAGVTLQGQAVGARARASTNLPLFVRGPAGSFDTTFATDGRTFIDGLGAGSPIDLFVSADDRIFVLIRCDGIRTVDSTCVMRLTPEGALDPAYGDGGVVKLGSLSPSSGVLLSDGRVVVGGGAYGESAAYGVVAADGQSSGPRFFPDYSQSGDTGSTVNAMALAPDGSVVMVFDATTYNDNDDLQTVIGITKITNAGEFDGQFGIQVPQLHTGGFASASFAGSNSSVATGVAVRPNGKILIAGSQSDAMGYPITGFGFLQLDDAGTPDTSFGTEGQALVSATSTLQSPVLRPDGRIVAVDNTSILAFTANGAVDTTFGAGGTASLQGWQGSSVSLDDQGRFLVPQWDVIGDISDISHLEYVWRLTPAGEPDLTFGVNGLATGLVSADGAIGGFAAARVQKDGRIVVVSRQTYRGAGGMGGIVVVSRLWN
ncbi:MAG: hypothetical protein FWD69_15190 [Polyangiaceae bacterium]|nr:hypothetical protein [Polyangiaceae bacterium]